MLGGDCYFCEVMCYCVLIQCVFVLLISWQLLKLNYQLHINNINTSLNKQNDGHCGSVYYHIDLDIETELSLKFWKFIWARYLYITFQNKIMQL